MPTVEQIKAKRAGLGLRAVDPEKAFPGFTLFAPQSGEGKVYLIDLDGKVVHTGGCLIRRATTVILRKEALNSITARPPKIRPFHNQQPWKGGAAIEVDWTGRVLWEVRHPDHHHDGIQTEKRQRLVDLSRSAAARSHSKIKGGLPGTEHQRRKCMEIISSR